MSTLRRAASLAAAAALVQGASAACPNSCNGHGRCVDVAKCECFGMWTGGDCSLRKCPTGNAWADVAIGDDTAHQPAECSNRGTCNHETGQCQCDEGYEGNACQRMSCPDDCSGHGECRSMRRHANYMDKGLQVTPYYSYTHNWDADMIQGCACDPGYTGWNCGERTCPTGDDPLTDRQVDEVQLLRCDLNPANYKDALGNPKKMFTLSFRGAVTRPFSASASPGEIRKALEGLPTIGAVSVSFTDGIEFCSAKYAPSQPASGNVVAVTFLSNHGDVPSLVLLDANGKLLSGVIDNAVEVRVDGDSLSYNTGAGSALKTSQTGTKENLPCSGRGECDKGTGACKCYAGFASSDGTGNAGTLGDCGYAQLPVTACPGYPNECSGHGSCSGSPAYKCTCEDGWSGGDCSIRTCPFGPAWFDYPTAKDEAHALAECSNKGECNRATGTCECQVMFEGAACERMTCPGSNSEWGECSGHGRCLSMTDLASNAATNGDPTPFVYGVDPNQPATWDGRQVYGCLCDKGWTGFDCSQRTCAVGEDITLREANPNLVDEIQTLTCQLLSTAQSPTFRLSFRGAQTGPLRPSSTVAQLKAALEELDTIGVIDVEARVGGSVVSGPVCSTVAGTKLKISFMTEHGDVPPIQVVMDETARTDYGGYSAGEGWTDTDLLFTGGDPADNYASAFTYLKTAPVGYIGSGVRAQEVQKGDTVAAECSGRGICDRETGTCRCFRGFGSSDGMRGPGDHEDCGWREPYVGLRG